jgi:hypothetical protein
MLALRKIYINNIPYSVSNMFKQKHFTMILKMRTVVNIKINGFSPRPLFSTSLKLLDHARALTPRLCGHCPPLSGKRKPIQPQHVVSGYDAETADSGHGQHQPFVVAACHQT